MQLDFNSFDKNYNKYRTTFKKLLASALKYFKYSFKPIIGVTLVDNEFIHNLNKEYRKIDRPTDVISFAFLDGINNKESLFKSKDEVDLGEIYISIPKALEQAKEYGHCEQREFCFLFVHGLLHLLGYDHMKPEEEKVMFELQDKILSLEEELWKQSN